MTAKEYLNQYRDCVQELRCKKAERDQLLEDAEAVGEPDTTEIEIELERERKHFYQVRREIRAAIKAVPSAPLRCLLTYRYICGAGWNDISRKMHLSHTHVVNRLQNEALNFVENYRKEGTSCN